MMSLLTQLDIGRALVAVAIALAIFGVVQNEQNPAEAGSFNVPVDEDQRIRFTVGVESGAAPSSGPTTRRAIVDAAPTESQALPVVLSLLSGPDSLKLVRGFYVIVPLFENDGEPRWSDWQLRRVEGRMSLVNGNGDIAPFEHFVLRVDYAS